MRLKDFSRMASILPAGLLALASATACAREHSTVVEEAYLTERDAAANMDSVAVWHGSGNRHWLIATAKDTDELIVFDAVTGEPQRHVGGAGEVLGRFSRPNGVSVIDDMVIVVERDNRRVQVLRLPDFKPLGAFGADRLERPYGLWVMKQARGYRVYITDAYELPGERIPPDAQLDRRVQLFEFTRKADGIEAAWLRAVGETKGQGVLRKVESLYGDAVHERLLIADESARRDMKVFDRAGAFTGRIVGQEVFRYEPEGIALYACGDGSGYWFAADQDDHDNRFHLFDRETLQYLDSFAGRQLRNTDGVWLTRAVMPGFPHGAFYAVHDDGNVGAFRLDDILDALNLSRCVAPPA